MTPIDDTPDRSTDHPADRTPAQAPGTGGDLPTVLAEQIDHHVLGPVRARLEGLSDQEYFYDPTADGTAWTVHPRVPEGTAPPTAIQGGSG